MQKEFSKQWFETGDFPTEVQFAQVFDWLRWNDQKIGVSDLTSEIINILNSAARLITLANNVLQWDSPAGTMIDKFLIKDSSAGQNVIVRIGTTPGGNEIVDDQDINTTDPLDGIITKDYYSKNTTPIYFTLTAADLSTLTINIYKS